MDLRRIVTFAVLALALVCGEVRAQSLAWDTNPGTAGAQGGTGDWVGTNFWFDGTNNVAWADNSLAMFGATAGNVTVNSSVSVNGMAFTANGYSLSGASIVTLVGPVIDVPTAGHQASINTSIGGSVGLIKNGPGILALLTGSPNTFSGTTLVNDGTLFFNKSANAVNGDVVIGDNQGAASSATLLYGVSHQIPDTARVTVNTDGFLNLNTGERQETIGTLEMNGGLVSTALGAGALMVSAVQSNASAATAMITGQLDLGGAPRTFNAANGAAASDLEISANIFNGGVTKTGAGTLTLTGTSLFTGGLAINGGVVSVPDVADLLTASPIGGGNLSFDGGTLMYTGAADDSTNRSIALNSGGGTFHIPTSPRRLTLSGLISGTGGLTKTGGGTLLPTGTNTFTGPVTVTQSTITVTTMTDSGVAGPLGAGTTFNVNGGGGIFLTGAATVSTNRAIVIGSSGGTFSPGNGTVEFSGPISGLGNFTTTGPGVIVLSGTNTFGGNVLIAGNTLRIANGNAIPDTASVIVPEGVVFDVNGSTETIGRLGELAGAEGTVALGGGTLSVGADNASTTFDGVFTGAGGTVSKIGTGTLTLTAASSFTGTFAINGGAVSVPDVANSGIASPLGAGSSLRLDGGTLTVTAVTSDSMNRAITLNAGGGTFDSSSFLTLSGVISGPGGLTKRSGPITLTGTNTFTGPVSVTQGGLTVPTVTNSGVPGPLGAGNRINLNNGALLLSGSGTHSTNRNIVLGPMTGQLHATTGTLAVTGPLTGSGGLAVTGNGGVVLLSGNNTFTGTVFLSNQGILRIANGNAIPDSGQVTLGTGTVFDVNNSTETIGALSSFVGSTGTVMLGSGTLTVGDFNFSIPATTYDGVISGTGNLVKSGFAQLTLTGQNTFTGGLTILNGPLAVPDVTDSGVIGPLGAGTSIILGAANGVGTLLYTGASDDSTNRPIVLSVQGGGVNVANAATALTLSGPITGGTGSFTKTGPGTLVLSGTNNYSASTTVTQGVLRLVGGNAIGDSSRVFFNGGTLDLNNTNETVGSLTGGVPTGGVVLGTGTLTTGADPILTTGYSGTISGAGGLTKIGPLTLRLTGTNTYSGPTNVNGGTLEFSGGNVLANTSPLIVSANAIAEFLSGTETIASLAGAGDVALNTGSLSVGVDGTSTSFTGVISGTGNLTKIGTGTLTLSAAPTYTGNTNINAGTLALNGGLDSAGGTVTVAAAAFLQARNVVSRRLAGTGTITATGTLIIGDASSVSGFAFGGTLAVGINQVVLADADVAELGPLTTLGAGGRLNSLNGTSLAAGDSVTADAAFGASISGDLTNHGTINGPTAVGQMLSLTGDVDGTGNYTGNVRFTDSFSPGNSAAAVSLENFILDSTHALNLELGGLTAGSEHDRLNFTGTGMIDGALIVLLINGFQPVEGHVFTLLNGGTLSGAFDSIALPPLNPGLAWQYSQTASTATLTVIPEPSSAALLFAGIVVASSRRRRADS